jgi:GntR family transcriptional regulator
LRIERRTRIPDGRIVEFTRSVYRGDRYEFVTDLNVI